MSENDKTFLCGGVLFFMLMKAVYPDGSSRDHRDGIKDEHKAPDVMSDLIYTFTGSRSFGSEKDTSNYRECKIEGTVNVPFNDMTYIRAYVDTVKFHYKVAVERMCEFTRWHINPGMKEWLVRALLEVIEYDDDIDMLEKVFVIGDGLCKSKDEICNLDRYELEPFLVGVLCYILKYRCNKNGQGIDTLNYYGEKKAHKERMHKGNAGGRVERNVEVLLYEFKQGDQDVSAFEHKSILETDDTTAENEYEDKESDYGVPPESQQEDKRLMIIQHQTNVIQNGENNFNLTNNGIMNFDFGGGKK